MFGARYQSEHRNGPFLRLFRAAGHPFFKTDRSSGTRQRAPDAFDANAVRSADVIITNRSIAAATRETIRHAVRLAVVIYARSSRRNPPIVFHSIPHVEPMGRGGGCFFCLGYFYVSIACQKSATAAERFSSPNT